VVTHSSARTRSFGEVSLYFPGINNRFRLVVIRESMLLGSWTFAIFNFDFGLGLGFEGIEGWAGL